MSFLVNKLKLFLTPAGGGVPRQRGPEEGREFPHPSEKGSLLLGARPRPAASRDASLAVRVRPAERGPAEGGEAEVQDADRRRAASHSQRSVCKTVWRLIIFGYSSYFSLLMGFTYGAI